MNIKPQQGYLKSFGLPENNQGSGFDISHVKKQGEDELYKRTSFREPDVDFYREAEPNYRRPQRKRYERPVDQNEEDDLVKAFGQVDLEKSGHVSKYDEREQLAAQNLIMYSKGANNNNEPNEVVETKIIEFMDESNTPNRYMYTITELWKTLTEIFFYSAKLIPLKLPDGNEIFQKILNLIDKAFKLILLLIFSPAKIGEQAKKTGVKVKNYAIGLGVLILIMVLLYYTTYGKIVIDFFIDVTGYIINTDIRLEGDKFYMYLQMQAEKMIASLGILNYILSLLNNAVITAGKEAGEQAVETVKEVVTEMVEVVNEQLVQNSLQIQEQLKEQVPAIIRGLKNPMELAMLAAGVEGGRQGVLMIDNKLAEQAKLTYNILNNMATKGDLSEFKDSLKLDLQATEMANLVTNQELQAASNQELMSAIDAISDKISPIMTLMEKDVKLLNVLIQAIENNQQVNQEEISELIRLTEESLKTTNLGRILNNWNTMDSKTVLYTLYTAVNGLNILRGQNPVNRQYLLQDGIAGGRKTRKRRTKGKKKGATKKKIMLKKSVKRKAIRNGKRKGRKGKTCKKK